ncbi:MAG: hypothetical protein HYX27_04685 [Acidobacteria bacterium]|nr:hypothetical protein [Acidobacteriota bacterium]
MGATGRKRISGELGGMPRKLFIGGVREGDWAFAGGGAARGGAIAWAADGAGAAGGTGIRGDRFDICI